MDDIQRIDDTIVHKGETAICLEPGLIVSTKTGKYDAGVFIWPAGVYDSNQRWLKYIGINIPI